MKRVLLTISYDGTDFHGWQYQPELLTVQGVLEEALYKLFSKKVTVIGSSRTDAGVHANGFCCHLDCDDNIPDAAFLRGINSLLPPTVAVLGVKEVESDFHARYDALGKTYIYHIYNSNKKDAFKTRYAWHIERSLNIDLMNEFCQKIVGTHDFSAFCSAGATVETTVRTIKECCVEKNGDDVTLTVTADGFLYNMVRIIVGTAVAVSDKRINPTDIDEILNSKKRDAAGMTAPPQGLFLEKVIYDA
ncbi:MAG: tRNA pseudouridine(38-40) synthase TruA [Clostridia bacterium]|nr:tRNA pseudouridine(38-40) synthase TruA [Clostridia bacterium]